MSPRSPSHRRHACVIELLGCEANWCRQVVFIINFIFPSILVSRSAGSFALHFLSTHTRWFTQSQSVNVELGDERANSSHVTMTSQRFCLSINSSSVTTEYLSKNCVRHQRETRKKSDGERMCRLSRMNDGSFSCRRERTIFPRYRTHSEFSSFVSLWTVIVWWQKKIK